MEILLLLLLLVMGCSAVGCTFLLKTLLEQLSGAEVGFGACWFATILAGSIQFCASGGVLKEGLLFVGVLGVMVGMLVWSGVVYALGQRALDREEALPAKTVATIAAIMSLATSLLGTGLMWVFVSSLGPMGQ